MKIHQALLGSLALLLSFNSFSLNYVVDQANIANTAKILSEAKAQLEQLKAMQYQLQDVKSLLGTHAPDLNSLSAQQWLKTLDGYTSINIDGLSALNSLGYKQFSTNYNDIQTATEFLKNQLYPKSFESASFTERGQARRARIDSARTSTISGVALSAKHKHRLANSQKEITTLAIEGKKASDVLSAMRANNQLLSIMASEMIQQREIMAHLMEMIATHYASQDGTVDLTSEAARKR